MFIISSKNYNPKQNQGLGGKAENLFYLDNNNINVPDFLCITSKAYYETLNIIHPQIEALLKKCNYNNHDKLHETSNEIQQLISLQDLPISLKKEWNSEKLLFDGVQAFSVRSSALNEDSGANSFAGQLSTFLNVEPQNILENVKKCWASMFNPSALVYMHKKNISPLTNGVSVVIQKLVQSKSSGVLFQADPKGSTNRILIAAGYGLGEGIVSDKVESDLYTYDKIKNEWKNHIEEKKLKMNSATIGSGIKTEEVDKSIQKEAVLTENQRDQLLSASAKIEQLYNHYQDIEWAFDDFGELHILQSRPITTIPKGSKRTFDNSNIVESYPGVILPLTFSLFRKDYYASIRGGFSLMRVPEYILVKHEYYFKYLVGYIQGRSYYNINNWYRLLLLSPFFKNEIRESFEKMIGAESSFDKVDPAIKLNQLDSWRILYRFVYAFFKNLFSFKRKIKTYFKITQKIKDDFKKIDLENSSSDELIMYLDHFSNRVVKSLGIPVLNDFYSMIFMELTSKRLSKNNFNDSSNLLNKLLVDQNIASAKPVRSMEKLIELFKKDSDLQKFIRELYSDEVNNNWATIHTKLNEKGFTEASLVIKKHIDNYGFRALKELVLEEDTFSTNPFRFINILLKSTDTNKHNKPTNNDKENLFEEQLKKVNRKWLLKWLLNKTRKTVANRELTRMDRGKMFDLLRGLSHEIGRKLVEEKSLKNSKDIFYITIDELSDFSNGCSPHNNLTNLVEIRKKEVEHWKSKDTNEILFTSGSVYSNPIEQQELNPIAKGNSLQGFGCSPGKIRAKAMVVHNPFEAKDLQGKILVALTTDPGWVFLMTTSAGLVSEKGSILSHTAIIGRELGIPTVVGVKGASKIIKNESFIEIDGGSGRVKMEEDIQTDKETTLIHNTVNSH